MRLNPWLGGLVATGVASGALVIGGGTAFADSSPADGTAPGPSPTAGAVCTERIPKILARIDRLSTRIGGDAHTRGSTRWLQDRQAQAKAAGNTALADLLQIRLDHRADRTDELAIVRQQVEDVKARDCTS